MGKTAKQRENIKLKAQPQRRTFDPVRDGFRAMAMYANQAQDRGATVEQAFQSLLCACIMGIQMADGDATLMFLSAIAATGIPREKAEEALDLVYRGVNNQAMLKAMQLKDSQSQSSVTG